MRRAIVTVVGLLVLAMYGGNSAAADGEVGIKILCSKNEHCPWDSACRLGNCFNPCKETCGKNSICFISRHRVTKCACLPNHLGNPYKECISSVPAPKTASETSPVPAVVPTTVSISAPEPKAVPKTAPALVPISAPTPVPKAAPEPIPPPKTVPATVPAPLPDSFAKRNNTGKKLYIGKDKKSWPQAVGECYSRRMHIVSINSMKEQVQLEEAVKHAGFTGEDVWLGLIWARQIEPLSKVLWTATGKSGTFISGLPFNYYHQCTRSIGHCYVSTATNNWCEAACTEHHYFACEYYED